MKSIVIYYSKSGNTKSIVEVIAKKLQTRALPLNLMEKKGRGTEEEREKEKKFFSRALEASKNTDLLIIGTPTSFKKAHSKVIRFTRQVEAENVGLCCTYYNKIGTTLTDLEEILKERKVRVVGKLELDNLKQGQFRELEEATQENYFRKAEEFVEKCKSKLKREKKDD